MTDSSSASGHILKAAPYLRVRGGIAAIEFYKQVFGAVETYRLDEPSGRVGHAELAFGPNSIMVSDEYPEHGILGPQAYNGTGSLVHLQVDNVDEVFQRAVAAGATVTMPPQDQFYGMRHAKVRDPFGHEWGLGQTIEQVSNDEIQRRFTEMCQG